MMADPDTPIFPVSDDDHQAALKFTSVTVTLFAIALATIVARISMKVRHGLRLMWDDYLLIVGCVLAAADWALLLATIASYVSKSQSLMSLNGLEYTIKLGVVAVPCWCVSITCIKVSVAIQLLRFQTERLWRLFLYSITGFVLLTYGAYLMFDVLQCFPLKATWDLNMTNKKCVGNHVFQIVSNTQSGISIATDIILSLFPLTFLHRLRRPRTEKILIGVLMAMGMAASAASVTKAVLVHQWASATDSFKFGFAISMWTCVEMFIGIIAACLPSLKTTFQKLLVKVGIDFTANESLNFFKSLSTKGKGAQAQQPAESLKLSTAGSRGGSEETGKSTLLSSGNGSGTLATTEEGGQEKLEGTPKEGTTRETQTV